MGPIANKVILTIPTIMMIVLSVVILKNKNSETDNLKTKILAVILLMASLYWGISLWL